jgi:hypothetical protein
MADDTSEIQSHIDRHASAESQYVKTIYVYQKQGRVKLRYGWNYRFNECEIEGVDFDEEYNQGQDGDNAIHIFKGSLKGSVEFKNSIVTIEGCEIDAKYKKDPELGLVASGCRLSFRGVPKELGEETPLLFKSKPPALSGCEVDMIGVTFKDLKKMVMIDTCRLTAFGITGKDIKEGGEIKKSSTYLSGVSLKLQKGNLTFSECSGEISGLGIKLEEEGTAIIFQKSDLGLHKCQSEVEKGTNWMISGSAIRMEDCKTEAEKGTNLVQQDGGYLRLQDSQFQVKDTGQCLSISGAKTTCSFIGGSALVKLGTCVEVASGATLLGEKTNGIDVAEIGTAIKCSGGKVIAREVKSITVGKMGPACDGSGGATFEFIDCGTIAGIPKSLIGDDVTYVIRGEKTKISGDISFKGTLISGHADEST